MKNVVLSTRNIDDLISDIANEVIRKLRLVEVSNKEPEPTEQFLTVEQAASLLNLTVPTIYSKVSKGELPNMKRGKRLYFSKKELLEYLKKGKRKTHEEIALEAEKYFNKQKKG